MGKRRKRYPELERKERQIRDRKKPPCSNCGVRGSHFVPPSLGAEGFFICKLIDKVQP